MLLLFVGWFGGKQLEITWLGSRAGENSSSACRDRLYRISKGRARVVLTELFNALHTIQTWSFDTQLCPWT